MKKVLTLTDGTFLSVNKYQVHGNGEVGPDASFYTLIQCCIRLHIRYIGAKFAMDA